MSDFCEYELRCQNTNKCYRCFDQKLLKLPEDKQKNKNSKTKVFRHEVANAEDSWKDLEQNVADSLKKVPTMQEVRRSRRSGALWFEQGDVVDSILHPECKERTGNELKSGEKSISIQRGWLEKASLECQNTNKLMCLPFRFKGDEQIYNIMKFEDIAELVTMMKAYMMDNEAKAKEIEALKKILERNKERINI